jgi:hypothetical protein
LVTGVALAQKTNTYIKKGTKLDAVFAVDDIVKITFANNDINKKYILTKKELALIKSQLKSAVCNGRLWL